MWWQIVHLYWCYSVRLLSSNHHTEPEYCTANLHLWRQTSQTMERVILRVPSHMMCVLVREQIMYKQRGWGPEPMTAVCAATLLATYIHGHNANAHKLFNKDWYIWKLIVYMYVYAGLPPAMQTVDNTPFVNAHTMQERTKDGSSAPNDILVYTYIHPSI